MMLKTTCFNGKPRTAEASRPKGAEVSAAMLLVPEHRNPLTTMLNPVFYYNRLLDLRLGLYKFKLENPDSVIIFRTPNYYSGFKTET